MNKRKTISIRKLEVNVKAITLVITLALLVSACATPTLRREMHFTNRLADEGLWQEARYRWEKQLRKNPDSPALLNNLAVAMEQLGRREQAEELYKRALKLAPGNTQIKKNYERFMNPDSDRKEKADEKPKPPQHGDRPDR